MIKFIIFTFFLFGFFQICAAQDYEYGKPDELKGRSKVYIDAGADVESYDRIKKVLVKEAVAGLTIVDEMKDADIILSFRGGSENVTVGRATHKQKTGKGFVALPDEKRLRVVMNFESSEDKWGEAKPATKFAKKFIEEYKKANNIK